MTNMDKLYASVAANGPVCVGLDTEFSYLPADVVDYTKTAGENVVEFNRRIIEATKASAARRLDWFLFGPIFASSRRSFPVCGIPN